MECQYLLVFYLLVIDMDNLGMQTPAHRRLRLAELIRNHYGDKQANFIAETEQNQGEISGILGGKKAFGEKKAAALESVARIAPGSLDQPVGTPFVFIEQSTTASSPNEPQSKGQMPPLFSGMRLPARAIIGSNDIAAGPKLHGKLPLISWAQARTWDTLVTAFAQENAEDWLDCPVPHSKEAFCLRVIGDTMDDGTLEGYREGEIIFIDPAMQAEPGKDVIARSADGTVMFRRLKEDPEGLYLLGLNGKKITRLSAGADFLGVVIFSGVKR